MTEQTEQRYDSVKDVPTDLLAHNFVGSLIRCKGDLGKYKELTMLLIRELRGEPHPSFIQEALKAKAEERGG